MSAREEGSESPCRRWLVLVACFVVHMTTASMSYHTGVLHVSLLNTFGRDVVTTAWLGSVYSSLASLIGPVASLVITNFDCRTCLILSGLLSAMGASCCFFITQFYLLYPALIVAGMGQGFSLIASYVAIGYNFPSQASLLTGICVCGSGLGIFIHPPLLQTLVSYFGFHGAMLVLGAISLHAVACGLAIPPSSYEKQRKRARQKEQQQRQQQRQQKQQEEEHKPQQQQRCSAEADDIDNDDSVDVTPRKKCCCFFGFYSSSSASFFASSSSFFFRSSFGSLKEVLSDFRFLLLLVTSLGFSCGLACYYIYLPDFLLQNRYDELTASFVLSVTGMGSIPSRLLTGVVSTDPDIDSMTFFFGIHALAAVFTLLVPFTVQWVGWQMALAALQGMYTGAVWACYSPLLLELLGVRRVADGVGLYLFTMGVGFMAGPPLVAQLYTFSGNFHHVFYFTAAMFAMASGAAMLSTLVRPRVESPHHSPRNSLWRQSLEIVDPDDAKDPLHRTVEPLLFSNDRYLSHDVIVTADVSPEPL